MKGNEKKKTREKVVEPKLSDKIRLSLSAKLQMTMVWHLIGILLIMNIVVLISTWTNQMQQINGQMESISTALTEGENQKELLILDPRFSVETKEQLSNESMVLKNYYFDISFGKKEIEFWNFDLFFPENSTGFFNLNSSYYAFLVEDGHYVLYPVENLISQLVPQSLLLLFIGLLFILNSTIFFHKKVKRALQPIDILTERVHEVGGHDMNVRLSDSGTQKEFINLTFEINELLNRIQKAYSEQAQFVSDASHELRTPIAVIQGYADLLSRWGKDDPETLEESIQAIRGETRAMNRLVEQLLFLARGDHQSTKIKMEPINISNIIREVYQEAQMVDKTHEFILKGEENLLIYGDESLMKQLLRIFLDNATKYTPENEKIIFFVGVEQGFVSFYIEDEGMGIAEEELPHVFDRFYRIDKTRNRKDGGTGLGLAIAEQILEIHGAQIEVTSRVGIGTRFTVTMPQWTPLKAIS